MHALIAENLHGRTFGVSTAQALSAKIQTGNNLSPDERFKSIHQKEFSTDNFRRFCKFSLILVERPESIPWKDYVDFAWTLNDENPKDW